MKRLQIYFALTLLCLTSLTANVIKKQDYYFRHLDTEKGLSQNTVLCILQDRLGFMWFGTKDGLNRYDGNTIKVFKKEENNPFSIGNNTIWSILEATNGELWIGTEKGIFIYNPTTDGFRVFDKRSQDNDNIHHWVTDMEMDKNGNIWITTGNVFCYSPKDDQLRKIKTASQNGAAQSPARSLEQAWTIATENNDIWVGALKGGVCKYSLRKNNPDDYSMQFYGNNLDQISKVVNLNSSHLLLGSFSDGMKILDKKNGEVSKYNLGISNEKELYIREISVFSDGNIWIGTQSGLYVHDPVVNTTVHLYHNSGDQYSLSDNAVYSMYEDREGGIWIGTYFGGVNYFPNKFTYFRKYYPVGNENTIKGERVSGICEDANGYIWIGTEDAGLNRQNPQSNKFEHFEVSKNGIGLNYENVHDIVSDGNLLWIGTFSHGINVFNQKTNKWKYYKNTDGEGSIDNNDIFALYKDSSDNIWVGTSSSAFIFDRKTEKFIRLNELNHHFVSDIIEDHRGNIWFSTYDTGAYCYDPKTKEYTNYTYNENDSTSICHHKITCMFVDSKKRLWFASESRGICMFDENSRTFVHYGGTKDGFSNNVIYKILEDENSNLWLSSNAGLMRFNPETKDMRIFTQNNGLSSNQFNYKSGYKDKTGRMYFGTVKGLITFQPSEFNQNDYIPASIITEFKLQDGNNLFKEYISKKEPIVLNYKQNSFSINFAALSYVASDMNKYAYQMEGLENNWNYIQKAREITYSNLPHGKYIFRVKGSNNDGLWNEEGDFIEIIIEPPFWLSIWAYLVYGLLILSLLFLILNYYKRKTEAINRSKRREMERQKEKEIYNAKIDFFTNVAHEVRTPLTLIKGPLEYIIKTDTSKDDLMSNLKIMDKNADRLLTLINQLLDFRKTEAQGFSLYFTQTDICELLNGVFVRFKPLAEQRGIKFDIETNHCPVTADVDKEALTKIISNLFTNALKYADSFILVALTDNGDNMIIKVTNDGKLIPENLKENIFEPFFQIYDEGKSSKSGSGIGLALVKSLVELHKGKVYLDVVDTNNNSFVISLPKTQDNSLIMKEQQILSDVSDSKYDETELEKIYNRTGNKSSILVVEDNEELLQFISDQLEKSYIVYHAKNGLEAIEVLKKEIINLVVSDIMMPIMDGLELCLKMKENQEYSHIPVILLTAKTNIQSRIEGLESGADAYIEKPFSLEYLYAQIENLLNNRKKLHEAFANSPLIHAGSIALNKADEQFLNKLNDVITKNISNLDFNVDRLAEELCMSRSSLLRKIKGVSEISPNDFIRLIRLKKAAEILNEGLYKVNEVCFLVGFSSASYFSKAFLKQFGVLPKDFVKK